MKQTSRRKKLSQEVSASILGMIERGEVPVGGQLPVEGNLVELFNVSRTSVREAVKSLAAVGVLEIRPGIGTFVHQYTSRSPAFPPRTKSSHQPLRSTGDSGVSLHL